MRKVHSTLHTIQHLFVGSEGKHSVLKITKQRETDKAFVSDGPGFGFVPSCLYDLWKSYYHILFLHPLSGNDEKKNT